MQIITINYYRPPTEMPGTITMISTIILDFDGVILESASVKTEAFRTLFSFVPDHVEEIVQFHKDNGGMSRYDKIRYIYNNILEENLTKEKFEVLSETFAVIVFKEVIEAPFVPGAKKFLETYYSKIPLYIVSATPEEELTQIILKRNLSHYFRKVFGAPRKKSECINDIKKTTGFSSDSIIFIGDAKNDYEAAQAADIRFIGRIKTGDEARFKGLPDIDALIPDLYELERYIGLNK